MRASSQSLEAFEAQAMGSAKLRAFGLMLMPLGFALFATKQVFDDAARRHVPLSNALIKGSWLIGLGAIMATLFVYMSVRLINDVRDVFQALRADPADVTFSLGAVEIRAAAVPMGRIPFIRCSILGKPRVRAIRLPDDELVNFLTLHEALVRNAQTNLHVAAA